MSITARTKFTLRSSHRSIRLGTSHRVAAANWSAPTKDRTAPAQPRSNSKRK